MLPVDHNQRLSLAQKSLDGLSVGDAFGETFFGLPERVAPRIEAQEFPPGILKYTDDTVMAISVVDVLGRFGSIDQDYLSKLFSIRFVRDPMRGYGSTAFGILDRIAKGQPWEAVARAAFDGTGSMGNGAAMRVGPVGAYFHDDLEKASLNARLSAEVTHTHPEGVAGAIAVAVAAAHMAASGRPSAMFESVLSLLPKTATRDGIAEASALIEVDNLRTVIDRLGNGSKVLSQDTVPFALWCVARSGSDFRGALWRTVAGLGDRDTTCAIVGSIVSCSPKVTIPIEWLEAREPLSKFKTTNA